MSKRSLQEFMKTEYELQRIENLDEEPCAPRKKKKSQEYDVKDCRIICFYAEKG